MCINELKNLLNLRKMWNVESLFQRLVIKIWTWGMNGAHNSSAVLPSSERTGRKPLRSVTWLHLKTFDRLIRPCHEWPALEYIVNKALDRVNKLRSKRLLNYTRESLQLCDSLLVGFHHLLYLIHWVNNSSILCEFDDCYAVWAYLCI